MTPLEFWPDYGPGPLWTKEGKPADLGALPFAVRSSGRFRIPGAAGTILCGGVSLYGPANTRRLRRCPVAVSMNEFSVTFDRHGHVVWETLREVRLIPVAPRLLFFAHPSTISPPLQMEPPTFIASHRGNESRSESTEQRWCWSRKPSRPGVMTSSPR